MRHFVVVVVVDCFAVVVVAQLEGIYIVVVVGPANVLQQPISAQ